MKKVRYAVVGFGHVAQVAVLPVFHHARINSQMNAITVFSQRAGSSLMIDMTNACKAAR